MLEMQEQFPVLYTIKKEVSPAALCEVQEAQVP
jgi:hypothetical protein